MLSMVDLNGSDAQSNFAFSFEYLSQDHIHVYIDGEETTDFSFSSAFIVTLDTPLSGSHTVRVRRITPIDEAVVDFSNGSVLGETDLDFAGLQLLFAQQEIDDQFDNTLQLNDDDVFDAQDKRIINLAEPEQPTDATTKQYVDGAMAAGPIGHALSAHNDVDSTMVHAKGDLLSYNLVTGQWEKVAAGTDGQTLEADSSQDKGVAWKQGIRKLVTTAGDLVYATASGVLARLGLGGADTVLFSNGTLPAWASMSTLVTAIQSTLITALQTAGAIPSTGDSKLTWKTTADTGWVLMNDLTIGNAASSATGRANADTVSLFTLFWNNTANAQCAVSGGRGANAAADYAANKTIALPKSLGRAIACSGTGSGLTARALALTMGSQDAVNIAHSHTASQAAHSHTTNTVAGSGSDSSSLSDGPGGVSGSNTSSSVTPAVTVDSSGVPGTDLNYQPTLFMNLMVKL